MPILKSYNDFQFVECNVDETPKMIHSTVLVIATE